jgi:phosphoglycolate phosphatase-like HAD superfamily hydrolase
MASEVLVLFDIDKTLIDSSKVKDEIAFPEAIENVYGVEAGLDMIEPHGMTDQQIVIDLASTGVSKKEAEQKISECMNKMERIYSENIDKEQVTPIKGARKILKNLEAEDYGLGLVTGNLESIGREKLKQVEMENFFPVGGFGDNSRQRSELVKIAERKAEKYYGQKFENVILIGDSPKDIKAGKEASVKTVGVTMGIYSQRDLREHNPNAIIDEWNLEGLGKIKSLH